jgi:molybdate transport system ATP-binding protein
VLEAGRIVQRGPSAELLSRPATPFVARFAGLNHLSGVAARGVVRLDRGGEVRLAEPVDGPVSVLVAPWDVALELERPPASSAMNHLDMRVRGVAVLGARARVTLDGLTAEVTPASVERLGLRPGVLVVASFKATAVRALPRGR